MDDQREGVPAQAGTLQTEFDPRNPNKPKPALVDFSKQPNGVKRMAARIDPARIIKAEMKFRGHTYKTLARKLAEIGSPMNPESIANSLSRGNFSAGTFLKYLTAMGCKTIQITNDALDG